MKDVKSFSQLRDCLDHIWGLEAFSLILTPFQDHVGVHLIQLNSVLVQWDIQYRRGRDLVKGSGSEWGSTADKWSVWG